MPKEVRINLRMLENQETNRRTVSRHQQEILHYLAQNKHISIGELAALLGVSHAAATKNVDRLVRKRLVKRKFDEMDRRRVLVLLTPLGLSIINEQ